jgi:hypothetical protein
MLPLGDYSKPIIPWQDLHTDIFAPNMLSAYVGPTMVHTIGCGPAALSLLLPTHPLDIFKRSRELIVDKKDPGTPGVVMKQILEEHGVSVHEVTQRDLYPSSDAITETMADTHILLMAGMLAKNTASWFVYWNNFEWHSAGVRKCTNAIYMNRFVNVSQAFVVKLPSPVAARKLTGNHISNAAALELLKQMNDKMAEDQQNSSANDPLGMLSEMMSQPPC